MMSMLDGTNMAKATNIHVVLRNNGWIVRKENTYRATSVHQTQRDAVAAAREIARNQSVQLLIHRRDGRIRSRISYGEDSMPPQRPEVLFPEKISSARKKAINKAVRSVLENLKARSTNSARSLKRL
jgi:hypothetical protein